MQSILLKQNYTNRLKFIQNLHFLKTLEYKLNVSIEDIHPKRFYINVKNPPKMDLDNLKQIDMMSTRIRGCSLDFNKDQMKLDMMKHGNKKKRTREIEPVDIPKHYNLKKVDIHIKKIVAYVVAMTEMEFTLDLKQNPLDYDIYITDMQSFGLNDILHIADKFSAFIDKLEIDFPKKKCTLTLKKFLIN